MQDNFVVIGAGYGDEGKGLLTDYLVSSQTANPVVNVRFNGGAQAGHTVVRNGQRHVFSHVGAGSFAGAETYLSSKFIFNPFQLHQELISLKSNFSCAPTINVHQDAQVTTIYDIVLNRAREISRGSKTHGSCGMGINETVTRGQKLDLKLTVKDLFNSSLTDKILLIDDYFRAEMTQIFDQVQDELYKTNDTEGAQQLRTLMDLCKPVEHAHVLKKATLETVNKVSNSFPEFEHYGVVFEGAQGLELDEHLGEFPHVTRSVTGLPSAVHAAHEIGVNIVNPVYVTRTFKTRHGSGPLDHEGEQFCETLPTDLTNVHNKWQGSLRYAPLDICRMRAFIEADLERGRVVGSILGVKIGNPCIAITHCDILSSEILIYDSGRRPKTVNLAGLMDEIQKILPVQYQAFGPTANDVKCVVQ